MNTRYSIQPSASMLDRFMSNVIPEALSGCWIWHGALHSQFGYGAFKLGDRKSPVMTAHRASFLINKGDIPVGNVVRHICDNPSCVNPDHLEVGTHKDNANDKVVRGRQPKGEKAYNARATDSLVIEMRKLPRKEGIALAVERGISRQAASDIMSNRTWRFLG